MKKLKILLLAASPFAIGYLLNYAMLQFNWFSSVFLFLINSLFFLYWFYVGYLSAEHTKFVREAILVGNSFAFLSIALILFQELVLGRYLTNIIGLLPQMFYLPTVALMARVVSRLLFFLNTHYTWVIFIFSFIAMVAVYYGGYSKGMKKYTGKSK